MVDFPNFPEVHVVRYPAGTAAAMKAEAYKNHRSMQGQFREIIAEYLRAAGRKVDPAATRPRKPRSGPRIAITKTTTTPEAAE
jgi:hypothetical protein